MKSHYDFSPQPVANGSRFSRRGLIIGGGLAAAGLLGAHAVTRFLQQRVPVFIARNQRYDRELEKVVRDGLLAVGIGESRTRGKRVLLKPNMVEPTRDAPHVTTHPSLIIAASEVFRKWGAKVTVGEAPGHVRDTEMALYESQIGEALHMETIPFVDLNYEDAVWTPNAGRASKLKGFYFPQSVADADLVVSMPKMKTHHWIGVTASMKNLYGVIPGVHYGWPKNVLHHYGIPETVYDINATLPRTIAIVDGIDCMEGDGPIMGSPKQMGVIVIGAVPTAVDATVCRLMGIEPEGIAYLRLAARGLGPIDDVLIDQHGEDWQPLAAPFRILDVPHLKHLTEHRATQVT